jgi:glycerol kinase
VPDFVVALDQGTTSSRAILFDRGGGIRALAQREFEQHYPRPGWVEHDPTEIWSTQAAVVGEVLARAGIRANDVAAAGITNQRETTIVWDRKTLEPLHNAIVWQDRRTAGLIDALRADGFEEEVQARTGLVLDAYFSASKLAWLLDHVDGLRARAERGEIAFGTVDSWLAARLSGGELHVTDISNASRTMLFNIHERDWDDVLLERLDIPRAMMPDVRSCSEVYGTIREGGLAGVALAGMAGDQQAATFGQACFEKGQVKNTYGTGCFLVLNSGSAPIRSANRLLTTVAWEVGGSVDYALEGSIFMAGAVVQWLRDGLGLIRSASEVEALAGSVPDNGGVYLVPAFAGLGAPHWDAYARGTVVGLTRGSSAGHLARAALEAIAFQVADVVQAMQSDSGAPIRELRVDGGAARNDLLMQLQADILGVPVVRPTITETTALGAAYLAGLAVGFWQGEAELASHWTVDRRFEPGMADGRREGLLHDWRRALERAGRWVEA